MMRTCSAIVLVAAALPLAAAGTPAQENTATAHATRVIDLLQHDRIEDVTGEFNERMAAAMPAARLRELWAALRQQAGALTSILNQRVVVQTTGNLTVVSACQFEKGALNVIMSFDAADRIAGMNISPRAPPAAAIEPPPATARFTEEAVTIGARDWALPGTLSMPTGAIAAAVVLVHGSGPGDRDETLGPNKPFRDLAWGLADRGIAVLRYDKRTLVHGARLAADKNLTVREETVDDALLAAAVVRKHDRIEASRVFVLGHSLGGTLAPRIAAEDRSLAGIVILAGTTRPFWDVAREQLTYLASVTPGALTVEQELQAMRKAAPEAYWKDLDAYSPTKTAAALTLPVLILQGERDYQVTFADDFAGWKKGLDARPNVTFKSYPALNHLFMAGAGRSLPAEYNVAGHVDETVVRDIAQWILRIG
jgi:uncharacterized protein